MRLPVPMLRARAGLFSSVLSLSLILASLPTTAALAQPLETRPVLDSAPKHLRFGGTAVIKGHLKDGSQGQQIALQHKRIGGEWRVASTKPVDRYGRVTFKRQGLRKTTVYRLRFRDGASEFSSRSDKATVRVFPKLTLKVNPDDIFAGRGVRLSGHLWPAAPDRKVLLQQKVQGEWRPIKRVPVQDGYFAGRFQAEHKGHRRVRVIWRGDSISSRARTGKAMTIYERDPATWYGPGLYGNRTACGQRLTTDTLGVAHRSLPCGTKVSLLYRGRTITVPVIDRGPYSHADWDLTSRTAQRLGFSGSEDIGTTR